MAEGTNVGNIYLDLIVRDTVEKQVQNMAAKGQAVAQKAFSGVERAAESMADGITKQATKPVEKLAETMVKTSEKMTDCFKKVSATPAEKALHKAQEQADKAAEKVRELESALRNLDAAADSQIAEEVKVFSESVKATQQKVKTLKEQIAAVKAEMADAPSQALSQTLGILQGQLFIAKQTLRTEREILDLQISAVSEKVDAAFAKRRGELFEQLATAQEKFAAIAARVAQMQSSTESAVQNSSADPAAGVRARMQAFGEAVRQDAENLIKKEEKTANRRKGILASLWKNMLANAGASAKSISGKITGIIKKFTTAGKATRHFGSRLREIASGALIFNGISAALRGMVNYLREGIATSDEMKQALANLKGAAANAASPLIQVLTPALTALTNAAATALTYVERLLTIITGKVSNAADLAAKKAEKTAKKAERTLASFDQLNKLDKGSDDESSVESNYGFKGKSTFLDSILAAIKTGNWGLVGTLIAEKLNSSLAAIPWATIHQKVQRWTQSLVDTLNGFVHKVDFRRIGNTLGQGLNTILLAIDTFFRGIDWASLGAGIANGLNDMILAVDWPMLGRVLTDKLRALFELFHGFVTNFDFAAFGTSLGQMLNAAFDNIDWNQLWEDIKLCLAGLWKGICAFFAELEPDTLGAVISVLLLNAAKSAFNVLGPVIGKMLINGLDGKLKELKNWAVTALLPKATGWIKGTLVPKVMAAFSKIGAVVGLSAGWVAAIAAAVAGIVALIVINGDKVKSALNNLSSWISNVFCRDWTEFFGYGLGGVLNIFVDSVASLLNGLKEMFFGLIDVLTGVFTLNWKKFWSGLGTIVKGAVNGVIGVINRMITAVTNAINILFKLLSFKINLPNGNKIGLSLPQVTAPQIPYLADGGVIKQPTLAMVGEYSGASSNPEIVAPQSIIAETVASVMNDMMAKNQMSLMEVVAILRQILNAVVSISSGDIRIVIGGREVFQVVVDENNRAVLRNGKSPLKV